MTPSPDAQRSWLQKFRDAFRGLGLGIGGQRSFLAHIPIAAAVIALAAVLQVSLLKWALLLLCITLVLTAELINSAIEELARAVDDQPNDRVGAALDIAAGAVLLAAIGSSIIGILVFVPELWDLVQRWGSAA